MATTDHDVPPAFDPHFYTQYNADLTHLSPDAALAHYLAHGGGEGRVAARLAVRESLPAFIGDRDALEIGPFFNPFLSGPNVAYLDMLNADALRARAIEIGGNPATCPAKIDYVGSIDKVDRTFDVVFGSHSIEHQPDLVRHFAGVARILKPGGLYVLIIPDKRFCFDHFLPESTVAGVLEAYYEKRTVHALRSVIEHWALITHNDPCRHWAGDHGTVTAVDQANRIGQALDLFRASNGGYIDVHAWYFTPSNFQHIVETLGAMGLCALKPVAVYGTPLNRLEFCAVLQAG